MSGVWEFSPDGSQYRWISAWRDVSDLTLGIIAHDYGCRAGGDMDACTCPPVTWSQTDRQAAPSLLGSSAQAPADEAT